VIEIVLQSTVSLFIFHSKGDHDAALYEATTIPTSFIVVTLSRVNPTPPELNPIMPSDRNQKTDDKYVLPHVESKTQRTDAIKGSFLGPVVSSKS